MSRSYNGLAGNRMTGHLLVVTFAGVSESSRNRVQRTWRSPAKIVLLFSRCILQASALVSYFGEQGGMMDDGVISRRPCAYDDDDKNKRAKEQTAKKTKKKKKNKQTFSQWISQQINTRKMTGKKWKRWSELKSTKLQSPRPGAIILLVIMFKKMIVPIIIQINHFF